MLNFTEPVNQFVWTWGLAVSPGLLCLLVWLVVVVGCLIIGLLVGWSAPRISPPEAERSIQLQSVQMLAKFRHLLECCSPQVKISLLRMIVSGWLGALTSPNLICVGAPN